MEKEEYNNGFVVFRCGVCKKISASKRKLGKYQFEITCHLCGEKYTNHSMENKAKWFIFKYFETVSFAEEYYMTLISCMSDVISFSDKDRKKSNALFDRWKREIIGKMEDKLHQIL